MNLFVEILNLSLVSSYVIVFVLLARLLLKKAPKIYSYMLWIIVFVRLTCSFTLELPIGLINDIKPIEPIKIEQSTSNIQISVNTLVNDNNLILEPEIKENLSENNLETILNILPYVWCIGVVVMLGYSLFLYVKLKRSLIGSMYLNEENIYISDYITSPFVIDIINPKIYLPSDVKTEELDYIIAHEKTHIKRYDHITRVIAYFILSIHWFNPLVWIAYILSGRDMELSCDESVMKQTNNDIRKEYSQSLLNFATGRVITTPLSFGVSATIDTKERVKNIMNFKRPVVWVSALAVTSVAVLSIGCMSTPGVVADSTKEIISEFNTIIKENPNESRISVSFDDVEFSMVNYDNPIYTTNNSEIIHLDEIKLSILGEEIYLGEQNEGRLFHSDVEENIYSITIYTDINLPSDYEPSQGIVTGEAIALSFTVDEIDGTITTLLSETSSYFDDIISTEKISHLALEIYDYIKRKETGAYDDLSTPTIDEENPRITFEKDDIIVSAVNSSDLLQKQDNVLILTLKDIELSIGGEDIYLGEEKNAQIFCNELEDRNDYTIKFITDINRSSDNVSGQGEYIIYDFSVDNAGNITNQVNKSTDYFNEIITTDDIEKLCINLFELVLTNQEDNTIDNKNRSVAGELVSNKDFVLTNKNDKSNFFYRDGDVIYIILQDAEITLYDKTLNLGDHNEIIIAIDEKTQYVTLVISANYNGVTENLFYGFSMIISHYETIMYNTFYNDIITPEEITIICGNLHNYAVSNADDIVNLDTVDGGLEEIVEFIG